MDNNIERIKGENVSLIVFRKDDEALELYKKWYNNQFNLSMLGIGDDIFGENDIEHIHLYKWKSNDKRFNIMFNERIIGICSIVMDGNRVNAEVDILIGEKEYRKRGIGQEVIKLMIKFAFGELRIHRLEANVLSTNIVAIECYKKCGFEKCGLLHEKVYTNNQYTDIIVMEMIKDKTNKFSSLNK